MKKLKRKLKKLLQAAKKKLQKLQRKLKGKPPRRNKDITVGLGYVALWSDGSPGWMVPRYLHHSKGMPTVAEATPWLNKNVDLVRCRITIEILRDKKGRTTTKVLTPIPKRQ